MKTIFDQKKFPRSTRGMLHRKLHITPDGGLWLPEDGGIAQNQSPDLLNLWFRNGALTLRPGMSKKWVQSYGEIIDVCPRDGRRQLLCRVTQNGRVIAEKYGIYLLTPTALLTFDGTAFERVADTLVCRGGVWQPQYGSHNFSDCFLLPAGGAKETALGTVESGGITVTAEGEGVLLIGGGQFLTAAPAAVSQPGDYPFTYAAGGLLIGSGGVYVPTLYTGCTPAGVGCSFERRNLVGKRVSQSFTTDGRATLYQLCDGMLDDETVTVQITKQSGRTVTYTFYPGFTTDNEEDVVATLSRENGTVSFSTAPAAALPPFDADNLLVTWSKSGFLDENLLRSRFGVWHGEGESGSRLFLSGSPGRPDTVWFSGQGNPGYFAQGDLLAVGDPSGPVTAFGRQYDVLAVFKESGVYSVGAGSGGPAVRQVHEGSGCDMPGSIRLIDNALVWGSSSGGLFTLRSTSLRDERAVRPLSGAVNPLLLSLDKAALQKAVSVDTGEYYLLFAGRDVFAWDYASTPYPPGKANLQAQRALAFYRWQLPVAPGCPFLFDGRLCFAGENGVIFALDINEAADDGVSFDAYWHSKPFDFGSADEKVVTGLSVGLRSAQSVKVGLECYDGADAFVTELPAGPPECRLDLRPPAIRRKTLPLCLRRLPGSTAAFGIASITLSAVLPQSESLGTDRVSAPNI